MHEVRAGHTLADVLGDRDARAGLSGSFLGDRLNAVAGPQISRRCNANIRAQNRSGYQQRVTHVVAGITDVGVAERPRAIHRCRVFAHGEEVGQHLCGVPGIGESVEDWNVRVLRQFLNDAVRGTAVFNAVVHARQDPCGIGDGFLVSDLA